MSTLSIKSQNTKSTAPKKGSAQSKTASRRKVTSAAATAKKPPRSVESKRRRSWRMDRRGAALANARRHVSDDRCDRTAYSRTGVRSGGDRGGRRFLFAAAGQLCHGRG